MRREKREIDNKIVSRASIVLWMIVLIFSTGIAAGETEPNFAEPNLAELNPVELKHAEPNQIEPIRLKVSQVDTSVQQDKGQVSAETGEPYGEQLVQSINFRQDMPIRDVLRFLAAKYHKNIIPSARVDGKINISNLYDVTFEEALDAVLGHNFFYKYSDNSVKIYTKDEYDQMNKDHSRMSGRVFPLYYVNAAEVKALILPVLSDAGKIGTTTASAADTAAGKGGDTISMRDTIVVYDFPETLDLIGQMIKEIDVKPQQILIEVTILQAKLTETTAFGINWNTIKGVTVTQSTNGITIGFAASAADIPAGTGLQVGFTHDNIVSLITAIEGVTDATVLANPKIMALNKQAGNIKIGDETGYKDSTTNNVNGTQTQSIAFLQSGTILTFRPFICEDGQVRMEISHEESTASLDEAGIPSKSTTEVKTNIMVKDGKTIIIGGLFKENLTSADSQVPVAGDLPIVGALFKKTKDSNIRTELIVLITPHIINEPNERAAKDKQDDISRLVHGSRKRMSSISRMRIYEDIYASAVKHYTEKKYKKALGELNWIIGFRPDVLEAVKLKEKILAQTNPDKYKTLERIMLEQVRKEQEIDWSRK